MGDEYRALSSGVAVVDRTDVGRLSVTGGDAVDLLDRLSTNALSRLEVGAGAVTVLTTNKGRIVDLLHVHRGEGRLVVFTSPGNGRQVAERIEFYTFVEDVHVEDVTAKSTMLSLAGPGAGVFLDELTNGRASSLALMSRLSAQVSTVSVEVYRSDLLGAPSFEIVGETEQRGPLLAYLRERGAVPVGADAVEAFRIERGIPTFGAELTEDYNPHEANLVHHVSFSKGCYIGQEVIARLQAYRKVQKYLAGLRWSDGDVAPGSFLSDGGKRVGVVTSAARLPDMGANVGLGYVRRKFVEEGRIVSGEGGVEVEIKVLG